MDINGLIEYLIKLQEEGKGAYKVLTHSIDYNSANGGSYNINENEELNSSNLEVKDKNKTITFGSYSEYYSY